MADKFSNDVNSASVEEVYQNLSNLKQEENTSQGGQKNKLNSKGK